MKTTPVEHRQPLEGWPSVDSAFVTAARNGGFARAALGVGVISSLYQQTYRYP